MRKTKKKENNKIRNMIISIIVGTIINIAIIYNVIKSLNIPNFVDVATILIPIYIITSGIIVLTYSLLEEKEK